MLRCSSWFVLRRLGLLGLSIGVGCATDTTGPTPLDAAHLYYQLTLNHHAITMALTAPYDTLRLSAVAQSAAGAAVVNAGPPTYTVQNGDTNISVSPTGLLTAVAPDQQAQVIANLTIGNVTHADTAIVNVNDVSSVPDFQAISFDPEPGDSAKVALNSCNDPGRPQYVSLNISALDDKGDSIPNVNFYYKYLENTNIYNFEYYPNPYLQQTNPGIYPLVAEATVYGVTRTDTLLFSEGWPLRATIAIIPSTPVGRVTPVGIFSGSYDTVAAGAVVIWHSLLQNQPIDVVFADPSAAQAEDSASYSGIDNCFTDYSDIYIPNQGGGDIDAWTPVTVTAVDTIYNATKTEINRIDTTVTISNDNRARRFPTVGTYPYHSALYGTSGVIVVLPEFQGLPIHTTTR